MLIKYLSNEYVYTKYNIYIKFTQNVLFLCWLKKIKIQLISHCNNNYVILSTHNNQKYSIINFNVLLIIYYITV